MPWAFIRGTIFIDFQQGDGGGGGGGSGGFGGGGFGGIPFHMMPPPPIHPVPMAAPTMGPGMMPTMMPAGTAPNLAFIKFASNALGFFKTTGWL